MSNWTPERDPRIDPKEGDILRVGGKYGGEFYEVIDRSPRLAVFDVSFMSGGREQSISLGPWRERFKNAEIIKRVDSPEAVAEIERQAALIAQQSEEIKRLQLAVAKLDADAIAGAEYIRGLTQSRDDYKFSWEETSGAFAELLTSEESLRIERDALKAEVAALREDQERWNYLESLAICARISKDPKRIPDRKITRQSIDDARKSEVQSHVETTEKE